MESEEERSSTPDPFSHHKDEQPEKSQLEFPTEHELLPPDVAEVILSIKELAERRLFHWLKFPITLPLSVTEERLDDSDRGIVNFEDLFVAPAVSDELEDLAMDEFGHLKKINKEQLEMIGQKGEFEVNSNVFPGQAHRWRLTNLLQKGSERTKKSFLKDIARSLYLLIITAKNRLSSGFFSIGKGLREWRKLDLLDLFIGIPSTSTGNIDKKVHEERLRYLVAELNIKPSLKKYWKAYCDHVKLQCQDSSKGKQMASRSPPIPYCFQTTNGQDIDLCLFNKDLMNNSIVIVKDILLMYHLLEMQVEVTDELIKNYEGHDLSKEELLKRVSEDLMDHYLQEAFHSILTNSELESLQPDLGALLVNQAKSALAMEKAKENLLKHMEMHKEKLLVHLMKAHPVKSLIGGWIRAQMEAFERDFTRQNRWSGHENAIALCEKEGLNQTVYFLRRDLTFVKEREPVLRKELGREKFPTKTFNFSTRIWFPRNWRAFVDKKRIKTVIRDWDPEHYFSLPETFSVEKHNHRTTTTRYPFWRWWTYLHFTWSVMWNLMFTFGIVIPWCSPLSFRALISPTKFNTDYVQSREDGSFYPCRPVNSLLSRLWSLWKHVRYSIMKFEGAPDRGLLGKGISRIFNRIWNLFFKLFCGGFIIITVFPVLCISVSLPSLVIAILSPVWVPVWTLFLHLLMILVWDYYMPSPKIYSFFKLFRVILWNLLCQGILQPICAAFVALIICPLASLFIVLFAILRGGLRFLWDFWMFHCIIKIFARVPARENFMARRISGPNLASNFFYQILPEQALAAVEAKIEEEEVKAWQTKVQSLINEPLDAYK